MWASVGPMFNALHIYIFANPEKGTSQWSHSSTTTHRLTRNAQSSISPTACELQPVHTGCRASRRHTTRRRNMGDSTTYGHRETVGQGRGHTVGLRREQNLPVLHTHDRYGHRIDEVHFHPAWHALMRRQSRMACMPRLGATHSQGRRWHEQPPSISFRRSRVVTVALSR